MPTKTKKTKKQLLKEVEVLKWQNADQIQQIAELRKHQADLLISLSKRGSEVSKLYKELDKTNAAFDSYKSGAEAYEAFAEAEIVRQADESTELRLKLLRSLTATVYSNAKKEAGVLERE